MTYEFTPRGVCSQRMLFTIENDVLVDLKVIGGCSGNLQGISSLVKGMKVDDIIARLEGIHCGPRPTSCPDQLARALKAYKEGNV
ncbi:MAG: TIGR03905 family TSCPD domain-containing protein [Oscillospiraceae bacterium]